MADELPEANAANPLPSEMDAPAPARRGSGSVRGSVWLKYLLGLPLGLIAVVALALMVLDSGIGHRFLADTLADYETSSGLRVQIGRINGSIFGAATLDDVQLQDSHGAFLRVPQVDLDWRPLNWFGSGLDIRNLALKRGTLLRVPQLQPGDPNSPLLPNFDIRIDRLQIDRLTVAKPVLGTERHVDFQAGAHIDTASVAIHAAGKLGGGDRLAAVLESDRAKNRFHLGLDYVAPKGGLLAALTGARVDRRARISGKGTYASWTGALLADQNGKRIAALLLTDQAGHLGLAGKLWTDPLMTGTARGAIGPEVALRGQGTLTHNVLAATLGAASSHWHMGAKGGINLGANTFDHLVITGKSLDRVSLDPHTQLGGARVMLVLNGTFSAMQAKWNASADHLLTGGTSLAGMLASGTASRETQGKLTSWQAPITLAVARIVTGDATVDPQLVALKGRGTLTLAGGRLVSNDLVVTGPRLAAHLALRGDTSNGVYVLAGRANARGVLLPSVGPTNADGSLVLTLPKSGGWTLAGKLTGNVPRVANTTLASLAGEAAGFTGEFTAGSARPVQISRASLTSPLLALSLSGQVGADGKAQFIGTGRHTSYGSFSGTVNLAKDGPHADLIFVDPLPAAGVNDMHLALAPLGTGFQLATSGGSTFGPFNGVLTLTVPAQGPSRIDVAHMTLSSTTITGGLVLGAGSTTGEFKLAGGGVSGNINLAPRSGGEEITAALAINDARFGGDKPLTIGKGKLDVSGLLRKNHTTITGSALMQGIGMGQLFIGKAAVSAKLQDGSGQITASLGGRRGSRFDLQAMADVAPGRLALTAHGVFAGQAIAMPRRAVLTAVPASEGGTGGWRLEPSEVDFGGGRTVASGLFGNGSLELRLGLDKMPLSLADVAFVDLGLGGRVSGLFTFAKRREQMPEGNAQLMITGLSRSGLVLTSRPIDLALVGKLDANTLEARAVASEDGKPRGRLQARIANLPQQGLLPDRLRAGTLFAQMRYAGPADALWRLMAIETFDLTGPLDLAADVTGTLADPNIRGSLASTALRLQSAQTGTDVSQITVHGSFNGARLSLTDLAGQTTGGGRVSGSGSVDFANMGHGRGPAIDLRLAARRAQLLSRPDLALAATGPLLVVSDGMGGTIAGRLSIDNARWRLGKTATVADLPNITTREINRGADVAPASVRDMPWRFLVNAAGPGRIQVEGMGLTSEWSADLRVRGNLDDPTIGGRADLITGTYEFAGRRFDLKRGRISFDGGPPNPRLDILATADVSGISASVSVQGTAIKPEIAFTSVPALPEEELLSRLLFGDSITKISAPEALQLGAALASLHGGGGLDPINKLRSAIGVDRLRIVSADASIGMQTGVAVGKYLGRHFYAEIVSDGRGYSATNLEFRITNWLSLLGTVSTIGRQSVNAKISKDY